MILSTNSFGHRLRVARVDRRLTHRQLAKSLGVSHATISYWENGKAEPSLSRITDIATELDVYPTWLAFGWGTMR